MNGDFAYAMEAIQEAAGKADQDAERWAYVIRLRARRGDEPVEDFAHAEAKEKETARQLREVYAMLETSRCARLGGEG